MANNYTVEAVNLKKVFGRRLIFNNLNFKFENNGVYGIAGANGSGKSTLVKIIAGIIAPSAGKLSHSYNGEIIKPELLHNHIGLVSPYLVLYDEFTAWENLSLFAEIRGMHFDQNKAADLLKNFNIYDRKDDEVKTYSSGMKQRLKFAFAFIHSPNVIILDEPISNLDNEGKEKVYDLITSESKNSIILVASNDDSDLNLCSSVISITKYKNNIKVQ